MVGKKGIVGAIAGAAGYQGSRMLIGGAANGGVSQITAL